MIPLHARVVDAHLQVASPDDGAYPQSENFPDVSAMSSTIHELGPAAAYPGCDPCAEAGIDSIEHHSWQLPDERPENDPERAQCIAASGPAVGITGSGILQVLFPHGADGRAELRRRLHAHRQLFRAVVAPWPTSAGLLPMFGVLNDVERRQIQACPASPGSRDRVAARRALSRGSDRPAGAGHG